MSESGSREAAATRSQGVVHRHLRSHEDATRLLAALLGRAHEGNDPSILVIAPTPEDALRLSELRAVRRAEPGEAAAGHLLTPVTSPTRGRRQLAVNPPAIIASPEVLLQLVGESRLRLGGVRAAVLVWPEELLAAGRAGELETLLAEVPRTADRVAIVAQEGPPLDEFLDRAMWRARRIDHVPPEPAVSVPVRFLTVGPQQRVPALRALLDALDPERAAIVTYTDEAEASARRAVSALGVEDGDEGLQVVRGAPEGGVPLAILIEPPDAETLLDLSGSAAEIIAIVEPAEVALLRASAGGGAQPFPAGGPLASAQSELDALRERVRAVVAAQGHLAWMPVLEPLLTDLDPVEVAAGAMALMHRSRRAIRDDRATEAAPSQREERPRRAAGDAAAMTRLFFGVGERDGIRRNDLVGAITAEAGITGAQIGKIVLRESHAVVEVDSAVSAQVIRKLGGASLRGRKLVVREDREAAPAPRGGSRPRPDRKPEARGARGASRRDAGERPKRDLGERPKRGREREEIQRVPRAVREGEEWASRADRLRHARRGAPKSDRE